MGRGEGGRGRVGGREGREGKEGEREDKRGRRGRERNLKEDTKGNKNEGGNEVMGGEKQTLSQGQNVAHHIY